MNHSLLNLVLALTTNEVLHSAIESMSVREKVKRLQRYIDKQPYKELRFNINTRFKSYAISLVGLVLPVAILWAIYSWINLSTNTALIVIIVMMVLVYGVLAMLLDKYHVEIERVTKRFKK